MSDKTGVVHVEFGKRDRDATRQIARLLGMLAGREAEILADPIKYFSQASKEIAKRDELLRAALRALRTTPPILWAEADIGPPSCTYMTVRVDRMEYERLRAAAAVIEQGITTLYPETRL